MINSFKQFIVEEDKTLYFTFGRMNPPTIGHEKLLEVLFSKSGQNPYRVYLSQTIDKNKNPLAYLDKVKYARKMMPKHSRFIMLNKNVKTIFDAAAAIHNEGFINIVMVVGSDRIAEFKSLLNKYNGKTGQRYGFYKFRSIEVVSAGERDPDSEGITGMSASKMREAAKNNDFALFTKGLPKEFNNKNSKDLFNSVRSGMGLKEETEFYKHIQLESVSDIREQYIKGEIYKVGERLRIKDTNDLAEVTFRGPNYLILEKENGDSVRKWIDAVEYLSERSLTPDEEKEKENIVKGMKHNKADFKKRYGDDAEAVMYATATKLAKENITTATSRKIQEKMAIAVNKVKENRLHGKLKKENTELDNYNKLGWGSIESTKKWVNATPGQVMPPIKRNKIGPTTIVKMRHPGPDNNDMGEGALKRGLLPSQDKFGPGFNKADHSNAKISKTTFVPKPPSIVDKAKKAKTIASTLLLKGSKNE